MYIIERKQRPSGRGCWREAPLEFCRHSPLFFSLPRRLRYMQALCIMLCLSIQHFWRSRHRRYALYPGLNHTSWHQLEGWQHSCYHQPPELIPIHGYTYREGGGSMAPARQYTASATSSLPVAWASIPQHSIATQQHVAGYKAARHGIIALRHRAFTYIAGVSRVWHHNNNAV